MSDARLIVRKVAQNEMGIQVCEEVVDVIEDIASAVVEEQTEKLKSEILRLKRTIVDLESRQAKRCVVCMDKNAEFALSSCMNFSGSNVAHLSVCGCCVQRLSRGPTSCPVCRASDGTWIRVA